MSRHAQELFRPQVGSQAKPGLGSGTLPNWTPFYFPWTSYGLGTGLAYVVPFKVSAFPLLGSLTTDKFPPKLLLTHERYEQVSITL